jgi:predicted RNase H-like HicB family nuclease
MLRFTPEDKCGINKFKLRKKMKTYTFRVVVEPDEDRWFAYCPVLEHKGGATWGYTKEEALKNIREVVEMTIESMIEHGEPIPEEPETEVKVSSEPLVAITV